MAIANVGNNNMKLPEKIDLSKFLIPPSNDPVLISVLELKHKINEIIDYLAEKEKQEQQDREEGLVMV